MRNDIKEMSVGKAGENGLRNEIKDARNFEIYKMDQIYTNCQKSQRAPRD